MGAKEGYYIWADNYDFRLLSSMTYFIHKTL